MIVAPSRIAVRYGSLSCALVLFFSSAGCAHAPTKVIRNHHAEMRLSELAVQMIALTGKPNEHYWLRVVGGQPKRPVDLWVLHNRHLYFSERLVTQVSEETLLCLIAHGVAHSDLHHERKRSVLYWLQYFAFLVGGAFVPGLSLGYLVTAPITDKGASSLQEYSADQRAIEYLTALGVPLEAYICALEVMQAGEFVERSGRYITTQQRGFESRIRALHEQHKKSGAEVTFPTKIGPAESGMPPVG